MRRVSFRAPLAEAERARARLLELAPHGFEEVDLGPEVEFAVYVSDDQAAALAGALPGAVATAVEPGWEERWRLFHRPVRAGGLWIGPAWEEPPAGRGAVVVDPGRAFGTGSHPTTRACIDLLAGQERGSLLDAGCGSGVVSVAAARLGFHPLIAVDLDPVAVETTRTNARRNRVHVDARQLDVLHDELPRADLVVANIELTVVEALLVRRPAGRAITSGYLSGEVPVAPGWAVSTVRELGGWSAHVLAAT